jgi:hypothetical protein
MNLRRDANERRRQPGIKISLDFARVRGKCASYISTKVYVHRSGDEHFIFLFFRPTFVPELRRRSDQRSTHSGALIGFFHSAAQLESRQV